jgi:transglutaminase-like putative cysteine protease
MRSWAERSIQNRALQFYLTGLVAINLLPFFGELPAWILVASATLLGWNFLIVSGKIATPPSWIRIFIGLLAMAGVFLQFSTLAGEEAATSLLILLSGLKLMESVRYRDAMLVTFICYFLLADSVLFSQSLGMTAFLILDLVLITSLLFYLHGRDKLFSFNSLKFILRTLAISLPLWIFLFFLFPRFSAQIWQLAAPSDTFTGFSDSLNPGEVEDLVQLDQVAFRATFLPSHSSPPVSSLPSNDSLYWRGAVLWEANGLSWSRPAVHNYKSIHYSKDLAQPVYETEIVLEPLFKKFIFPLDVPLAIEVAGTKNKLALPREGFIFERETEANARILFRASSYLTSPATTLEPGLRKTYLKIASPSPRVADILKSMQVSKMSTVDKEKAVLNYFKNQHFRYSLTPGAMPGGLEQFLFQKKVGFCEHYAAAFADFMRWLQVPTRVVVGFQGGRYNSMGDYYVVRTLDAHAWVEVWLDDESRWQRVDPTAAIVPLRLTLGGDFYTADPSLLQAGLTREDYQTRLESSLLRHWLLRSQALLDLAASRWNNFLLNYDFDYQTRLLKQLGFENASRFILVAWLVLGIIAFIALLQIWLRRRQKSTDEVLRAYQKMCEALAKKQLPKEAHEGPLHFSHRIETRWPAQKEKIETLFREFIELRYSSYSESKVQASFQKKLRNWKLSSRRLLASLK